MYVHARGNRLRCPLAPGLSLRITEGNVRPAVERCPRGLCELCGGAPGLWVLREQGTATPATCHRKGMLGVGNVLIASAAYCNAEVADPLSEQDTAFERFSLPTEERVISPDRHTLEVNSPAKHLQAPQDGLVGVQITLCGVGDIEEGPLALNNRLTICNK
ncbi:hypothetical protein NDU88_001638 [Pleurodeles waltl]|uniref:Uncharacterized protein n=1 Tax=Pleurodeles waltl TaxID=8319 RepID=A0AAV7MKB5_PLEWA|nr:hypothetical protein NDU88_001638 [Pleurodeles waltl]